MGKQAAVRLSDETYGRLERIAALTGRSVPDTIRDAVEMHLADLEDAERADAALAGLQRGEDEVIDGDTFWRGLAD